MGWGSAGAGKQVGGGWDWAQTPSCYLLPNCLSLTPALLLNLSYPLSSVIVHAQESMRTFLSGSLVLTYIPPIN